MIRLSLLGESWLIIDEVNVTTKLSKKSLGLLIYMVCKNQKMYYREALASLFWSDYTKESALNNLRHSLWQIRKQCKFFKYEDVVKSEGKHIVRLDNNKIKCDYLDYLKMIKKDDLIKASDLLKGDFLEDFYIPDVPEFSDWVFLERENIQLKYFDICYRVAERFASNDNLSEATRALNSLIKIDPLNEEVYYKLIKYHYMSGNKVAAINTYRKIKKILRDELSITPSTELQDLFKEIQNETDHQIIPSSVKFTGMITSKQQIEIYSLTDKSEIKKHYKLLSEYDNNSECLILDICETPGKRVSYEGLFEILDEIQQKGKYNSDVFINKLEPIISSVKNETISNDIFLFGQCKTLFKEELSNNLIFRVWGMHFLDHKTIDFMSYVFRKEKNKEIKIVGIYDTSWTNERLDDFIKAFSET